MKFFISVIVLLLIGGCIDPLQVTLNSEIPLVIFGEITDQPGPYSVSIYTGQPVDRMVASTFITAASVTISDDNGTTEELTKKSAGVYVTKTLQGVVGRTYTLKVVLEDGSTYESSGDKMLPVGEISNLKSEFYYHFKILICNKIKIQILTIYF